MASLKYWLWLTSLEGLTHRQRLALLEHFDQPDKVYFGESGEYALVEGMTRQGLAALKDKSLAEADRILREFYGLPSGERDEPAPVLELDLADFWG